MSPAAAAATTTSEYWSVSSSGGGGPLVEAADVNEWSAARTEALREWGRLESCMRNALKTAASYAVELGTLQQEFEETLDFGGARLLPLPLPLLRILFPPPVICRSLVQCSLFRLL